MRVGEVERVRVLGVMLAIATLCAACSGAVDDPAGQNGAGGSGAMMSAGSGASNATGSGGAGSLPSGSGGDGAQACEPTAPPPRAVLVTSRQYVNTLIDLLGPKAVSDADAATESDLDFEIVDRPLVTTASMDRTLRLAEAATESLRGSATQFFSCSALTDAACVRTALGKVARRAWKRAPAADELDALMGVYDEGAAAITDDDGESAALLALQAVLVAPSTLYRTEFLGTATPTGTSLSVDERASALAGLLLDSVPDEALLAAADDGSLMTPPGLQAQIDRLLDLPRVHDHLTALVLSAYRVSRIFETPKDTEKFPAYTPALQQSMYEESRRFVEDVLWTRGAPLSELLSSRNTFVDGALAELYGVAHGGAADTFTPATLPATRAGLLTQASVLSVLARTDKTSVVARGLFVRGALLCLPKIPGPPAAVQAQVAMQLSASSSQAELAAYRGMTEPCLNCHKQFDRFGLLLESFDPIGRERKDASEPIDFTGLDPFMGVIDDPNQLASLISADGGFTRCLAERTLAYTLTSAQTTGTHCNAAQTAPAIAQAGGTIEALISAIAADPMFTERTLEGP